MATKELAIYSWACYKLRFSMSAHPYDDSMESICYYYIPKEYFVFKATTSLNGDSIKLKNRSILNFIGLDNLG